MKDKINSKGNSKNELSMKIFPFMNRTNKQYSIILPKKLMKSYDSNKKLRLIIKW